MLFSLLFSWIFLVNLRTREEELDEMGKKKKMRANKYFLKGQKVLSLIKSD